MIENMILKGLGGVGMEHPTSVSYSATSGWPGTGTLTLSGITKEPFCVVWAHTYSGLGLSFVVSGIYVKDTVNNTVAINKVYRRSSNSNTWSGDISVTYNDSTDTLTVSINSGSVLDSNNLPSKSEIYCIY